jgi:predicted transcriptional regulator of viral defense system
MGRTLDDLYALAEGQDGFFTTRQAAREGVSKEAVVQAERRGRLERYQRGVYRLKFFPHNAGTAHYWEALLWPQARTEVPAILSHETALRLHGLSDTNPAFVHITVPRAVRIQREPPQWLKVHRADVPEDRTEYVDGLPVTNVVQTLTDLLDEGVVGPNVLHDARRDAERLGIALPNDLKARLG